MNKIDLSSALIVFSTFVECGSINSAAKSLGISRDRVRANLVRLKTILNYDAPLVRAGRLTGDGKKLLSRIRANLYTFDQELDAIYYDSATTEDMSWASQRHPVYMLEDQGRCAPIIFHAWRAWREGGSDLDGAGMAALMPWALAFRKWDDGWMLLEVGERSSFASWLGLDRARYAKSEVRKASLTGSVSHRETAKVYNDVGTWGAPIFHHVQACIRRFPDSANEWISYQRLVLPIKWGDDRGLVVFVVRTNDIIIDALSDSERHPMPADLVMDYDPTDQERL